MADGSDPLTPPERMVVATVSLLAMSWAFDPKRGEKLALLDGLPAQMRKDADFDALAAVVVKMRGAVTHLDWSFAASAAERALVRILRRDMTAALRRLPEQV